MVIYIHRKMDRSLCMVVLGQEALPVGTESRVALTQVSGSEWVLPRRTDSGSGSSTVVCRVARVMAVLWPVVWAVGGSLFHAGLNRDLSLLVVLVTAAVALAAGEPDELQRLQAELQAEEQKGHWTNVVAIARHIAARSEEIYGAEAAETATALDQLGRRVVMWGSKEEAEALHRRALAIREQVFGSDHLEAARSYYRLGVFLKNARNDRIESEALLRRCLEIRDREAGQAPGPLMDILSELGWFYLKYNQFAQAEVMLLRACAIAESGAAIPPAAHADALYALGWVYYLIKDFAKAERSLEHAYRLKQISPGPEHWETMEIANALAATYRECERFEEARELSELALRVRERNFGPNHAKVAESLCGLGITYELMDQPGRARPYFERAIPILERVYAGRGFHLMEAYFHLSTVLHDLAALAESERYGERVVLLSEAEADARAAQSAPYFEHLAELKLDLGKKTEALALTLRARALRETVLSSALGFTSEHQRLTLLSGKVRPHLLATLGVPEPLAESVLRTKGLVLDSLLEDGLLARASGDPESMALLAEIRGWRRGSADFSSAVARTDGEVRITELEAALARRVTGLGRARRALRVTVPEVQRTLSETAALIEFVRYDHYQRRGCAEARYGALLLFRTGGPVWIPLGPADSIERQARRLQHALRNQSGESSLVTALRDLTDVIWMPIEARLPEGKNDVIISPDGALSTVSFAALTVDGSSFVGERFWISYVSSGRDLLGSGPGAPRQPARLCILANPDFGAPLPIPPDPAQLEMAGVEPPGRVDRGLSFRPMPGAEREGRLLGERAAEFGFQGVDLHLGSRATETVLQQLASPGVLHVATHTFQLPRTVAGSADRTPWPGADPMLRSGLLLAGARHSMAQWAAGNSVRSDTDGIVTADEVASLDLRATRLVVLSACDSGTGEIAVGEGVLGLRRGFLMAGARTLMLSLWPVDDEATTEVMLGFYEWLRKTDSAPRALALVQRKWLRKLRVERGLAEACRIAGPFIVSFQGQDELVGVSGGE